MNKKTRKLFTWCLVVAMVVTQMLFTNVAFAANRNSGTDRYNTAIAISQKWTSADNVVIAGGYAYADALSAAPFAYQLNAPILLTDSKTLTDGVLAEIQRLKAKNVYIVGGASAVSADVEAALKAASLTVERISGADRYATSLAIANKLTAPTGVVVANGYADADALSVSSIAAYKGMPVLLIAGDAVSADAKAYIGTKTVYAVGGSAVINDAVVADLKATRLSGTDRYATNVAVLGAFSDLNYGKVYVATGEDAADALAGSVLAAKDKAPLVLVGSSLADGTKTFLAGKVGANTQVEVLGGAAAVNDATVAAVEAAKGATGAFGVQSVSAVGEKSLKVVFNGAVADTSKVTFSVKRDTNITVNVASVAWNDAKTEATLTVSYKLADGDYVVTANDGTTSVTGTATGVKAGKVSKIVFKTLTAAMVSGKETQATSSIKVENQYGEDVTKNSVAGLQLITSADDAAVDGDGVVTYDKAAKFAEDDKITITVVDPETAVTASATLTVVKAADIKTIVIGDLATDDDTKELYTDSTFEDYYLPLTVTDSYGNEVPYATITSNLSVYTSDADVAVKPVIAKYDDEPALQLQGPGKDDGTATITVVSASGVSATKVVTVKEEKKVDTFTMSTPDGVVKQGKAITIPYTALDQYGNEVTKSSDIKDKVDIKVTNGDASEEIDYANDDAYVLKVTPKDDATKVVITAVTPTGKSQTLTLSVDDAPVANRIAGLSSDFKLAVQTGLAQDFKASYVTIKDQYEDDMDLPKDYKLVLSADDDAFDTVEPQTAGVKDTELVVDDKVSFVNKSGKAGSEKITVQLVDDKDAIVDEYSFTYTVVDLEDITSFKLNDLTTLYSGAGAWADDYAHQRYAGKVEITGYTDNGTAVKVDQTMIKSRTTSTSDVKVVSSAGALKVYANKDTDEEPLTAKVSVLVEGYDSKTYTVTDEFQYTNVAPTVTTFVLNNSDDDEITASYKNFKLSDVKAMDGKKISSIANKDAAQTLFYFKAKDQYGAYVDDEQFVVTGDTVTGITVNTDPTDAAFGTVKIADATKVVAGKQFTITCIAGNGLSKQLTVYVVAD